MLILSRNDYFKTPLNSCAATTQRSKHMVCIISWSTFKYGLLIAILATASFVFILTRLIQHQCCHVFQETFSNDAQEHGRKHRFRIVSKGNAIYKPHNIDTLFHPNPVWSLTDLGNDFHTQLECDNFLAVIIVASAPLNFESRKVIRSTWGHLWSDKFNRKVKTVFSIGRTANDSLNEFITKESLSYKDVLQGDYLDSYRNLTLKVLHGMQWAVSCKPLFILKTDDDCFVNVPVLINLLANVTVQGNAKSTYVGKTAKYTTVVRNRSDKWFLSKEAYPLDEYVPYLSGMGYILHYNVAKQILNASTYIKLLPNEDAFIGIVAYHLGIEPVHSNRIVMYSPLFSHCNYLYILVIHGVSVEEQKECFEKCMNAERVCPTSHIIYEWS